MQTDERTLRAELLAALDAGDLPRSFLRSEALRAAAPAAHARFLRRELARPERASLPLRPLRIALLSSFSTEFLHDPLCAAAFHDGIRLEIYQAGFATHRQEILDPASGLYAFRPDVLVLAVEGRSWLPGLYSGFLASDTAPAIDAAAAEVRTLLETLRSRSDATVLVFNAAPPVWAELGVLDATVERGQRAATAAWNDRLRDACRAVKGAYVVDYAALVARHGWRNWYDDRMALYASAPVAAPMLPALADELAKFLRALAGRARKCLVVDLDNTLWGGVLGEDGVNGIRLGPQYPGNAYVALQEAILALRRRGVILAIASKNNPADVDEVFARHPAMVLRREHFAAAEIHWNPKGGSIAAIAQRLNIGLDHIAFLDDNPVECEHVRSTFPMVAVIQVPERPEEAVRALLERGLFDTLSFSDEDRRRGALYEQRDAAEALRASSASVEEFYGSLDMEVLFAPVQAENLERSAQLTQKTNQFNATTLRYTEAQVAERAADPSWACTTVRVKDRFGDNGIVGLSMARAEGGDLVIDTFLLSCRVIGRTIETAMLARLCEDARRLGAGGLRGRIVPTAKNAPARDLYERHGFARAAEGADEWRLDLARGAIAYPPWLRIAAEVTV
jgi:FkbH-like protein